MLIIKTDQPNTLVVTVSQNSELTNPEYLFSFTHIFSKEQVNFIPVDISTHKSRYDEFYFVEGTGVGQINFPYQGQYLYVIYEQPAGSGNLNPSLATNVVENGDAQIFPASASTMDSQYDIYISSNEDNSNIIFAPEEPNPTPNITPSITPSATPPASPTPTPSVTPTFTPTPSSTPAVANNPASAGATWWMDFSNPAFVNYNPLTGLPWKASAATEQVASVVFTVRNGVPNDGPPYYPTGYLGVSGMTQQGSSPLVNPLGTYTTPYTGFTWFGYVFDDNLTQTGGYFIEVYNGGFPAGQQVFKFGNVGGSPPQPYEIRIRTNVGTQIFNVDFTYNVWTAIAIVAYNDAGNVKYELWENGTQISGNTFVGQSLFVINNNQYGLMADGGIDYNTEQFWFNRRLNNTEIASMFSYLNTKY